jgi:hypothetical protein
MLCAAKSYLVQQRGTLDAVVRTFVALIVLGWAAHASAKEARPGPCNGASIDLADAKKRCTVRDHCRPSPPPTALVITVAPVTVKSGRKAEAEIVLANATGAPLTFDLDNTFSLEGSIVGSDGKPVNRAGDCGGGGIVGVLGGKHPPKPTVRVTLAPAGRLRATVIVDASVLTNVAIGGDAGSFGLVRCKEERGPPIGAGRYKLSISLPLFDLNPKNPGTALGRTATTDVTVTP